MQLDEFVLVVDDDPDMRSYLELALTSVGRVVAVDGRSALPGAPKLAFVDLLLAEGDGLGCIEALLGQGATVVVTTGLAPDAPLVERARQAGVVHFLHKPFGLGALRALATRLL